MEKKKLIEIRKKRGVSQQSIAESLCMDVSNYNRREKGLAKISLAEWKKIAAILEVRVEDIFESDDSNYKELSVSVNNGMNNVYTIPEFLLENQRKYIFKLEEENAELKKQLEKLKKT